jgi:hypothetical protein
MDAAHVLRAPTWDRERLGIALARDEEATRTVLTFGGVIAPVARGPDAKQTNGVGRPPNTRGLSHGPTL